MVTGSDLKESENAIGIAKDHRLFPALAPIIFNRC